MLHIEPDFFLTGILLVTSGSALAKAGPAPILISYTIVCFNVLSDDVRTRRNCRLAA